ncbi:hypothetical protein [Acetobacter nitrogenifigens]
MPAPKRRVAAKAAVEASAPKRGRAAAPAVEAKVKATRAKPVVAASKVKAKPVAKAPKAPAKAVSKAVAAKPSALDRLRVTQEARRQKRITRLAAEKAAAAETPKRGARAKFARAK